MTRFQRTKWYRSIALFVWSAVFLAVPLLNRSPDYTPIWWLTIVMAMVLGGLIVFAAMMPEKEPHA